MTQKAKTEVEEVRAAMEQLEKENAGLQKELLTANDHLAKSAKNKERCR